MVNNVCTAWKSISSTAWRFLMHKDSRGFGLSSATAKGNAFCRLSLPMSGWRLVTRWHCEGHTIFARWAWCLGHLINELFGNLSIKAVGRIPSGSAVVNRAPLRWVSALRASILPLSVHPGLRAPLADAMDCQSFESLRPRPNPISLRNWVTGIGGEARCTIA